VRRNLERWLNRTSGCKCCLFLREWRRGFADDSRHAPCIVLMDIQMPEMSGIECAVRLKTLLPSLQIIMLTVYEDTDTIFKRCGREPRVTCLSGLPIRRFWGPFAILSMAGRP